MVDGDPRLLKVTTATDLALVESWLHPDVKAVFFDVGETLVDEERWWRALAERAEACSRT